MELQEAVIVSGARTAVGRFGGAFKDVAAPDLGAEAIKAALERAGIRPEQVEEVVMGNALQATEAGYAARLSSLKAGIPQETPTIAINRQCSSGLEAINMAAQLVRTGEVDIAVAGGMENMSQTPYLLGYQARFDGLRMGDATMRDGLTEGLGCPVNRYHMGVTAENVAERFEVSREDQDELALISHQRAVAAIAGGRFSEQIVDVSVPQRRGDPVVVSQDEGPRADTTLERLASLRPVFKRDGSVTAGNASSINDGAAAVVIMSATKAAELRHSAQTALAYARCGRSRTRHHGHRTRSRCAKGVEQVRHEHRRHRPDRAERGVCVAGALLHARTRHGYRQDQCQRQRHQPGPPHRRNRRNNDG